MKLRQTLIALIALVTGCVHAADLTVFAAASLTDAMKAIAPGYQAKSGHRLIFNFAGSNALARQIKEGAPADIFLSADEAQMDILEEAGLVDNPTRRDLLSNTLVIVVPPDGPASLAPQTLAEAGIQRLAMADPKIVPAGVYARAYLTRLRLWPRVEAKVIPTENVRAALAAVESGNVDAGIVYQTDAAISRVVKVAYEVPREEAPSITYPGAVVSVTPNAAAAEDFLDYLESEEAVAVFQKYGFLPPGK